MDTESVEAFAQRLEEYHAVLIGTAARSYPLVFKVASPDVDMAGKTKHAFPDRA